MKNKGFTLVELLAIVTLLGIIAIIAIPVVTNTMSNQKEKLYYDQLNQLIRSAQNWETDHNDILINFPGVCIDSNFIKLTLDELRNKSGDISYLADDFVNPRTDENFNNNDTFVWIYKQEKNYLYCIQTPNCTNTKDEYKETASRICCDGEDFKNRLNCSLPKNS